MKLKRIAALIAALILLSLFAAAILLAVTGAPVNYLMAVLFAIVFVSVLLYAMALMARVLRKGDEEKKNV